MHLRELLKSISVVCIKSYISADGGQPTQELPPLATSNIGHPENLILAAVDMYISREICWCSVYIVNKFLICIARPSVCMCAGVNVRTCASSSSCLKSKETK